MTAAVLASPGAMPLWALVLLGVAILGGGGFMLWRDFWRGRP